MVCIRRYLKSVDSNGFSIEEASFSAATTEVVIGKPGAGGLVYGRRFLGKYVADGGFGTAFDGWGNTLYGAISAQFTPDNQSQGTGTYGPYYVSFLGQGDGFSCGPTGFAPLFPSGSTLTYVGNGGDVRLKYVRSDGTEAYFYAEGAAGDPPHACLNAGVIEKVIKPDGEIITWTYVDNYTGYLSDPFHTYPPARIQAVSNNLGYQIHFEYATYSPGASNLSKVYGIDMSIVSCAPTAYQCSVSNEWPSVTYSDTIEGSSPNNTIVHTTTDNLGRTTRYYFPSDGALIVQRYTLTRI